MTDYNAKTIWDKAYLNEQSMAYPSEYVIRIFKGKYPYLDLDKKFSGKKICDLGCGDGRDIPLLDRCGFEVYGTEISNNIIEKIQKNLDRIVHNKPELQVGTNKKNPFDDNFFDYLLSWNTCYYMENNSNFETHVEEMSRILKCNGTLILSIPKKSCFIYKDAEITENGYCVIRNDPFKIRNGAILRIFKNKNEIQKSFKKYFKNFKFASVHDDCFGLEYHWHIIVCQKK